MEGSIAFEFSFIEYPRDRRRYDATDRREWWFHCWTDLDYRYKSFGFRWFGIGFDFTLDW